MPILGERIYNELDQERSVCITGALSGGKTRLAFDLALRYWRKGYKVNSNVLHNFVPIAPDHKHGGLFRTFNIMDEGGEYIREAKVASLITRSAGKADYYMVFSGKRLPHKNLQDVIIKPRFDFWQNYGIPLILWRVTVATNDKYTFPLWQWLPSHLHGTFSTLSSSAGIEDILSTAQYTVEKLASIEGQVAGVSREATFSGIAEDFQETGR
jgi:hypothetical protein